MIKIQCPDCGRQTIEKFSIDDRKDYYFYHWNFLMNFVQCLKLEENITEATCEEMINHLLSLKTLIVQDFEREEGLNKNEN
jgi:hypothetical protein